MPNESYEVVTSDGKTITGVLDGSGKARIQGVKPGTCKVSYPNLSADAWKKV